MAEFSVCWKCQAKLPRGLERCPACGASHIFSVLGGGPNFNSEKGATAEILRVTNSRRQPRRPTCLTIADYTKLCSLVTKRSLTSGYIMAKLLQKLAKSFLVPSENIPEDVVTMNSRAVFRPHWNRPLEERQLVFPERYVPSGNMLPVTTPLGSAILGMRCGERALYRQIDGEIFIVSVEAVTYQPEKHMKNLSGR